MRPRLSLGVQGSTTQFDQLSFGCEFSEKNRSWSGERDRRPAHSAIPGRFAFAVSIPMKYDNMEPQDRARAARAAAQFLLKNDYVSLQEASEVLGLSLQELWDKIMAEAGLPACEAPTFMLVA